MKKYSLIIQFIGMIVLLISLIASLITKVYFYTHIIMGLLLLIIGYNNKYFYKRKYMTVVYILTGILMIGWGVYSVIGH
ncbi:MAG: hypothetical protein IKG27_01280 [Bacilli bacterium]|nr:hypothetical protein [Bacilli bacterium]